MIGMALLVKIVLTTTGAAPNYAVVQKFPIGGDGGWDCIEVDSSSQRLFISRGTHVMVLNVSTGKIVGDIPNTNGVHDIALVPKLNKGYISDGRDNAVMVFDLKTLKEIKQVPVGNRPDIMAYDRGSNLVFTFNGGSNDATAVDPKTDTVVGTIKLDGKPEFAQPDGRGMMYVNLEDKSEIQKVDTKSMKVVGSWMLAPGEEPTGLGYDSKHGFLFSACANGMMAISDVKTEKVVSTPKIGNGPDGAAYDARAGYAFSPNGQDGTLTIIGRQGGDFVPLATIATQRGARTMALDQKTHKIYLIAAQYEDPKPGDANQRPHMVPGTATILVVGPVKN